MSDVDLAEARAQLEALGALTGRDIADLQACTVEEVTTLAEAYRDASRPADRTDWDNFLQVLGLCAQVAGPLATIAGAFAGVAGAASAAKALR